jgi:hypothetical protein
VRSSEARSATGSGWAAAALLSVVLAGVSFAVAVDYAWGETDEERRQRHQKVLRCAQAESLADSTSRPIDRPFAEIHDSEELLFLRRTTGTAGNPAQPERVEITEYVGAKTGRRYACRISETRPQECLEIIFPGSTCLQR